VFEAARVKRAEKEIGLVCRGAWEWLKGCPCIKSGGGALVYKVEVSRHSNSDDASLIPNHRRQALHALGNCLHTDALKNTVRVTHGYSSNCTVMFLL
jgi:hypothetical protein